MNLSGAAAIASTLDEALSHDPSIIVLGDSVCSGGVAGATRGLFEKHGSERVIDVPISEHGAVGLAVGLALGGRRPILELTSSGRLLAVLEALAEAAAVARDPEFPVPLVIRVPAGDDGGDRLDRPIADTLAALDIQVASPSSPNMAAALIRTACRTRGPIVLLEPRSLYAMRGDVGEGSWPIGQARLIREGSHVTLGAWGSAVAAAESAAATLDEEGISADVVDLVSLWPVDLALLSDRTRATGRLVIVGAENGISQRILRMVANPAFEFLEAPPVATSVSGIVDTARSAVQLWF